MKLIFKLFHLFGLILITQISFAQQDSEQLSIYFSSGKSTLNTESKAALKAFAEKANTLTDYELELRAFTDDIGSIKYNKKLSEKRAEAVERYLKKLNLKPTEKIIEGLGEIALFNDDDVVKQRRENRRVDLTVKAFSPKDFNDFFSYLSDDELQAYAVSNHEQTIIFGEEGTIIKIPAKAFVNQLGQITTEIKINLKEAYSFGDMLKHNLGTTSGNQILQTGGMIYIDAVDASTGEKLNLKKGQEIEISMPSQQALDEGMELFAANRSEAGTKADWKPIRRTFKSRQLQKVVQPKSIPITTYNKRKSIEELKFEPELSFSDLERAPNYMRKPVCPKMPKQPRLLETEAPVYKDLKATTKKRRGESKKKYKIRLEKLLEFKVKSAETAKVKNKLKTEEFSRDSLDYLQQLVLYKADSIKYEKYLSDIESIVQYLELNGDSINAKAHRIRVQQLGLEFKIELGDFQEAVSLLRKNYENIFAEAERMGLTETIALLNEYKLLVRDSSKKVLRNERILEQPLKDNFAFWGAATLAESSLVDLDEISLTKDIKAYSEIELDELANKLQRIYDRLDRIQANMKTLNGNVEKFIAIARKLNNDKIADFSQSFSGALLSCYNKFTEERIEKGFASEYEKQLFFMNTVRSADLGWINCDRFLQYEGEKVDLLVNYQAEDVTRFFVVFKEMKSVLPLDMGSTGYSAKMYDGVPAGANVKIIGMRLKDGVAESFVFDGKTEEVANMKVEFKITKLEQLRKILEEV